MSEQLFTGEKYENLERHLPLFKDHGHDIVTAVKPGKMLEQWKGFVDKAYQKDVEVSPWPLQRHYLTMLGGGYWVNSLTAKGAVKLLQDMRPIIKNPNVKSVVLDIESFPLFGYLGDREKATEMLENEVDVIQRDYGKDVALMEWYFSHPKFSKFVNRYMSNLPEVRNAKKHILMAYPSMNQTRFASDDARRKHIESAASYGKKKYGSVGVDVGANDTGVYQRMLYPFVKAFTYGPEKMARDVGFVKNTGVDSFGVYSVEGMGKDVELYMKNLAEFERPGEILAR